MMLAAAAARSISAARARAAANQLRVAAATGYLSAGQTDSK